MRLAKRVEESGHNRSWIERISATAIGRAWGIGLNAYNGSGLPSFFVIGPPRTRTTWLYEILKDRTLLPAPTKETRFFDKHFHRGIDWYRAHYAHVPTDRHVGEIAPTYFCFDRSERAHRTHSAPRESSLRIPPSRGAGYVALQAQACLWPDSVEF